SMLIEIRSQELVINTSDWFIHIAMLKNEEPMFATIGTSFPMIRTVHNSHYIGEFSCFDSPVLFACTTRNHAGGPFQIKYLTVFHNESTYLNIFRDRFRIFVLMQLSIEFHFNLKTNINSLTARILIYEYPVITVFGFVESKILDRLS